MTSVAPTRLVHSDTSHRHNLLIFLSLEDDNPPEDTADQMKKCDWSFRIVSMRLVEGIYGSAAAVAHFCQRETACLRPQQNLGRSRSRWIEAA